MVHVVLFDCAVCKNVKRDGKKLFCQAYPEGIPQEYIDGKKYPHTQETCGNGTGFEDTRPPQLRKYMDEPL